MRHVFIINPSAGRAGRVKRLTEQMEAVFEPGAWEVRYTQRAGDARALAAEAVASGEPVRLYACGGDGTLNEVVNAAAGCGHAAVTNVPLGTGNDFLRIFGRAERERFTDLRALRDGPQTALDLMDCNGLLGLDVVCAGVDARVAAHVHRFKGIPLVGKKLAYVLSLITEVCRGISRPMTVEMGDIRYSGETTILCVCNGQYYGGGFRPAPEAMPDDGVLDILLVGEIGRLKFARYVGKYAAGRYRECPELIRDYHGQGVTFSSEEEITVVIDGEVMRDRAFTVRLSERKVNFFYPAALHWRREEAAMSAARS